VPIYEYVCDSCRSRFEVQQKFSDPPLSTCSKCGAAVRKVISSPAIMFKGTGWYVTDYSDKLKPPSGSDAEAKPKAEPAASEGSSDAKPAAAAPAGETAPAPPASTSSSTPAGGSGSSSTD
jgi:putative FmdB family regulatory protein